MNSNKLVQSTLLITGIMASGKSTIAQYIAESIPNSVHLRGDVFRKMIVNGRAVIEPPPSQAAMDQLRLRYQLAALTADQYCAAGFTVIYQDVIIGEILNEVIAMHHKWPLYVVVLCPSPDEALKRDAIRHKQTYKSWTPHMLDQGLRTETPKVGLWLDTSRLSIDETVATIHSKMDQTKL